MSNGRGKINLTALECAIIPSKKDKDDVILCIPVKKNNLFKSEKGNVYLDFIYNEMKSPGKNEKDTHIINQSVPKEVYEALKAAGKYAPTLGNLQHWEGGYQEPEPNVVQDLPENKTTDDLPF